MKKIIKNKLLISFILIALVLPASAQVRISSMFRAGNFWMPGNTNALNLSQDRGGRMELFVNQMKASGITHIRIGGKSYDQANMWSPNDLAKIINWLRTYGFEPIVQVPIDPNLTVTQNSANCAMYVSAINTGSFGTKPVEFWEIGNEPDGSYASPYNTTAKIAEYTRTCSVAMKAVPGQSTIKIIGPSLSYYDYSKYAEFLAPPTGTNSNSIMGAGPDGPYVDCISFNTYPISLATLQSNSTTASITAHLRDNAQFAAIITTITAKIATANRTGDLKIMITEANLCSVQDVNNKGATGVGPGSFLGGQFWAEMMAIGMEKGVKSLMFWRPAGCFTRAILVPASSILPST